MDLKNPRQNPANFSHNHDCANLSTQKNVNKKKWLRIFGAGGLAFFMGVGTLCGVLIAPMGATSASNAGNLASAAQSADSAQGLITPHEDDPVVFTTDYGLEIKYANAFTNTNLAGYTYFTMGKYTYNNLTYDVNWVIIGYDPTVSFYVRNFTGEVNVNKYSYVTQGEYSYTTTIDSSPAGKAIIEDCTAISSQAVENDEIGDGCVLCIAECVIGTAAGSHTYTGTALKTAMDTMPLTLGLTDSQMSKIQTVDVYCLNNNSLKQYITYEDLQFFPLPSLYQDENFSMANYLPEGSLRIGYDIVARSPTAYYSMSGLGSFSWDWGGYIIPADGVGHTGARIGTVSGVRPAFVLNLLG